MNGEDTSALTEEGTEWQVGESHSSFTNLATSGQLPFVEDYVLSICLDTLQKSMEPAME